MPSSFNSKSICLLVAVSLFAGCAASPPISATAHSSGEVAPGPLRVVYSLRYPDGSYLKEKPSEVRLVTREATSNKVAQQIGLNLALLALGGLAFQGFSKDDLMGRPVDGVSQRDHLKVPVDTAFVTRLQARVDTAMQSSESLRLRTFARPLTVAGGSTRLVYENLKGSDVPTFRLKTDLVIYKAREGGFTNNLLAARVVECSNESPEAWPQTHWAEGNYLPVKTQLYTMLQACEDKVIASLESTLLAD